MTPDVFAYAQYRRYLSDWYTARKEADPKCSHRWVAKRLGSADPSVLAHILNGRRSLIGVRLNDWIDLLELEGDAAAYFRALVAFEDAVDRASADRALAELGEIRARTTPPGVGVDDFEFMSAWYVPAVRELARLPGFVEDPAWIAARLDPAIAVDQAARALEICLRLGFLVRTEAGLVPDEPSSRSSPAVRFMSSWPYHRDGAALVDRGLQVLRSGQDPNWPGETAFLGLTTAIPTDKIPMVRKALFEALSKVAAMVEPWEADADRVFHVAVSMVPVTKPIDRD